jgi:tellurite methyltransferase
MQVLTAWNTPVGWIVKMSPSFHADWPSYYAAVSIQPPRHTLIRTLTLFDREQRHESREPRQSEATSTTVLRAADLGCGNGRDTILLLERGWQVLAIDAELQAMMTLRDRVQDHACHTPKFGQHLTTQSCAFADIDWPASLQLINASFSLPFCPPDRFLGVWQAIRRVLQTGGWFCGQLFGDRDEWSVYDNVTSVSRSELLVLLQGAKILELEEEEYDGQTATGTPKHWHIFHIIVQFPGATSGDTV